MLAQAVMCESKILFVAHGEAYYGTIPFAQHVKRLIARKGKICSCLKIKLTNLFPMFITFYMLKVIFLV